MCVVRVSFTGVHVRETLNDSQALWVSHPGDSQGVCSKGLIQDRPGVFPGILAVPGVSWHRAHALRLTPNSPPSTAVLTVRETGPKPVPWGQRRTAGWRAEGRVGGTSPMQPASGKPAGSRSGSALSTRRARKGGSWGRRASLQGPGAAAAGRAGADGRLRVPVPPPATPRETTKQLKPAGPPAAWRGAVLTSEARAPQSAAPPTLTPLQSL